MQGIWHQVTPWRLLALLGVEAVLLAAMLALTWYGAKRLGFGRADRVAIQFAGSKKSLAAGLPMATVLFGADASLAVLPLMLFHQMQLMVCAVIAKRRSRDTPEPPPGAEPVSGARPAAASRSAAGTATRSG
ncbi:Bile acid:sodium symporter OS=Streptomyces alboniger OX=132473 GN=CP975_30570 PE=4 SV=1 [Streptomyces alboniger]